jgi:hypothetical protein
MPSKTDNRRTKRTTKRETLGTTHRSARPAANPAANPAGPGRAQSGSAPTGRWLPAAVLCAVLTSASGLTGCASALPARTLSPGVSLRADVIASQGTPTRVWPEADGGSTLEYATQPFGTTCFMFRLDARGVVLEFHDALQPGARWRVQAGMTSEQVSRMLGRERRRESYAFSGEEVWDWNVTPESAGDGLRFNVHFVAGQVARTSQSMVLGGKGERRH